MIVPFQMVMFTLSKVTDFLHLGNMFGIIPVYLGFGAGLSLFMFCGFIKAIPISLEEAAMIDGCTPVQTYFKVIVPMLRPTMITVAILNAMWIWNDYLLPTLVLDSEKPTIPMAVQYLRGGYGSIDMGAMMAMLVLCNFTDHCILSDLSEIYYQRRSCRSSQRLTNAQKSFLLQQCSKKDFL